MCINFLVSDMLIYLFLRFTVTLTMVYPQFFWADWYTYLTHKGVTMVGAEWRNFQNLCLQILQNCTPWLWLFLDFFCQTFFKLLKFSLWKTLLWMIFKKFIYSNKKFVAASSTEGITWISVNYLCKRKSEYLHDLFHS